MTTHLRPSLCLVAAFALIGIAGCSDDQTAPSSTVQSTVPASTVPASTVPASTVATGPSAGPRTSPPSTAVATTTPLAAQDPAFVEFFTTSAREAMPDLAAEDASCIGTAMAAGVDSNALRRAGVTPDDLKARDPEKIPGLTTADHARAMAANIRRCGDPLLLRVAGNWARVELSNGSDQDVGAASKCVVEHVEPDLAERFVASYAFGRDFGDADPRLEARLAVNTILEQKCGLKTIVYP